MYDSKYLDALAISDPAERADALTKIMAETDPSTEVLQLMLTDSYDVIRAEALDFLIVSGIRAELDLSGLALQETSPIVRGRVLFYFAMMKLTDEFRALSQRQFSDFSEYDEVWSAASAYIQTGELTKFLNLCAFLFSDTYDVTGTALDILFGFAEGYHRILLVSFLGICAAKVDGGKINSDRVRSVVEAIDREIPGKIDVSRLKSELKAVR
jgi:hypothetical protein